ncbi:hypothetical protein IAU59_005628 [Kwoniella sp. CBS 9459]
MSSFVKLPRPVPPLPDEIWLDIFKLVQTSAIPLRPKAFGVGSPYSPNNAKDDRNASTVDVNTACLVRLMLVSKRFHDLLSPFVYEHAVISNPASFFYGIDKTPEGRLSKLDKLRLVQKIEFTWPKITISAYHNVLNGTVRDNNGIVDSYVKALHSVHAATTVIKRYHQAHSKDGDTIDRKLLLPAVETLHFGHMDRWDYSRHHQLCSKMALPLQGPNKKTTALEEPYQTRMRHRHDIGKEFIAELGQSARPRHICQHTPLAPYSYQARPPLWPDLQFDLNGLPITLTVPVGPWNQRYKIPLTILIGSTTRLMVSAHGFLQYIHPFVKYMPWLRKVLAQSVWTALSQASGSAHRHLAEGHTRIVVYFPGDIELLRASLRFLRPTQPEATRFTKDQILESFSQYLRGSNAWKNSCRGVKVDVSLLSQAGECPGCGRSSEM